MGTRPLSTGSGDTHAERVRSGRTEWPAVAFFYAQLLRVSPSLGAQTAYAAALGEVDGAEAGLAVLDSIDSKVARDYQSFWAVRAHLLERLGRTGEARDALDRAIALAEDPAVRQFLLKKRV